MMTSGWGSEVSRRTALAGIGIGVAGLGLGWDWLTAEAASATIPWCSPFTTRGTVYSPGGEYSSSPSGHNGVDFNNAIHPGGTVVRSCAAGTVTKATYNDGTYGTLVEISHGEGYKTFYGHMRPGSIFSNVKVGDYLDASTPLGRVGGTPLLPNGNPKYPEHLHLGLLFNGSKVDPTFLVTTAPRAGMTPLPIIALLGDDMPSFIKISAPGHPLHGRSYLVFPDRYVWVHSAGQGAIDAILLTWGILQPGESALTKPVGQIVGGYEAQWAFNEIDDARIARENSLAAAIVAKMVADGLVSQP